MASNYTENFGLCQWEATDQVLREEFNADHAKIDAALSSALKIITGSYIGTGTTEQITYTIGHKPKLLILCASSPGESSWVTFSIVWESINIFGRSSGSYTYVANNLPIVLQDTGFIINHDSWNVNNGLNVLGRTYAYWTIC